MTLFGASRMHNMSYHYNWKMKDTTFAKNKGSVFTTFAAGGGSTLGYKLAGFDVIGCNEIDPKMMAAYRVNHNPKYSYLQPIQQFKLRNDLPDEFYNLDIFDGSPPCSSFSMSGNREDDWGKEKKFREGQAEQVLDELFFDYTDLLAKLKPKVAIAENVGGLLKGNARQYVIRINQAFDDAGYYVQHFLLCASTMGVPQKRPRVFFVGLRKDLAAPFLKQVDMFTELPELKLDFNEPEIPFIMIYEPNGEITKANKLAKSERIRWELRQPGDSSLADCDMRYRGKGSFFNQSFIYKDNVLPTITATKIGQNILFDEPRKLTRNEFCLGGSFPLDYDFKENDPGYVVGMSVPPLMVAKISEQIYQQWLQHIK